MPPRPSENSDSSKFQERHCSAVSAIAHPPARACRSNGWRPAYSVWARHAGGRRPAPPAETAASGPARPASLALRWRKPPGRAGRCTVVSQHAPIASRRRRPRKARDCSAHQRQWQERSGNAGMPNECRASNDAPTIAMMTATAEIAIAAPGQHQHEHHSGGHQQHAAEPVDLAPAVKHRDLAFRAARQRSQPERHVDPEDHRPGRCSANKPPRTNPPIPAATYTAEIS
jgi:hypothetical protein